MTSILLLGDSLLHQIFSYSHAKDLMNSSCVCSGLRVYSDDESIWKMLCTVADLKQTSTRARGVKLWKVLYLSNLCCECSNDAINGNGVVKVDVDGGKLISFPNNKITLCGNCFNKVRSIPKKDRKSHLTSCKLLPKLKTTLFKMGHNFRYIQLIDKIPEYQKTKADKFDDKYDNPNINDTLLRLIKRKR